MKPTNKLQKKRVNEGIFDAADKFIRVFFDALERNTADQIIRQASNAKLPKSTLDSMERVRQSVEELRKRIRES